MNKTRTIVIVLLVLLVLGGIWITVRADTTRLDADTMRAALRTTTVEENGFIDLVVVKVNKGLLQGTWWTARFSGEKSHTGTASSISSRR